MVFKNLCILVHWTKVASALEGLTQTCSKSNVLPDVNGLSGLLWSMSYIHAGPLDLRRPGGSSRGYAKPCHVGTHWIALAEYLQMRNYVPGFQSFLRHLASFCIGQISCVA